VRIVGWHHDLVDEARAQSLDGPHRSQVVLVTGYGNRLVNRKDEWADGLAGLKRVTMTPVRLPNFESDVSGTDLNVFRIPDAKVDVADILAPGSQNAKVIIGHEAPRRLAWHNPDEL
jgi:hypothetical protein